VKRDDATGLSTGGNKTRKLEYLLADALEKGADAVITQGATQSNHARQTAAGAAKLGLDCHILLEDRTGSSDPQYINSGNVLLDQLHGATISMRPGGTDMAAEMDVLAERLRAEGKTPYVIPGGGSNPIGALGYVNCARELVDQAASMNLKIDSLIHATGSSGTQAGLVAGLAALESDIDLLGIGVRAPQQKQEDMVYDLALRTEKHLGLGVRIDRSAVRANCDYVGPGYGLPAEDTLEAIEIFARTEAILLDPVYSAKGAAGLIDLIRKGHFKKGERVVFLHTGGAIGLTGYTHCFDVPK